MNRLLLDTHVMLWWAATPDVLSDEARQQIESADAELWVSAASFWELAIKQQTGKIRMPDDLLLTLQQHGVRFLDITSDHALAVASLPLLHRDPFDRMLVAQAQAEQLTLVTRDPNIMRYDVRTLPA